VVSLTALVTTRMCILGQETSSSTRRPTVYTIRYDTRCCFNGAHKLTWVTLIYRTQPTTDMREREKLNTKQEAQLSPRDRAMRRVSWNLASCHATVQKLLVRQCTENKSKLWSGTMCNKHVHSTMTRSSRFYCPIGVINKPTTVHLWISPVYRRLAVAKFSNSIM